METQEELAAAATLDTARALQLAAQNEAAGELDRAEILLRQVLGLAPHNPGALHLLGIVAFKKGRKREGLDLVRQAIAGEPGNALYYRNVCAMLRGLGHSRAAVEAGRRAAALAPNDPQVHHNLSVALYDLARLDEAIACNERALALDPNMPSAHFGLAEALLLRGEFARGWEEYEWRFRIPSAPALMPKTDKPQWQGETIDPGTLMLIADQGFGDVIQFCRYIPWARTRCQRLVLACSADVAPVVRQIPGIDMIFGNWKNCPDFTAYAALSGLPRLHGTRTDTIPGGIPYLHADPALAETWARRIAGLVPPGFLRVGIVWAGRPTHGNDHNRSLPLPALAPLLAVEGVAFLALQKGPAHVELARHYGSAPLINLAAEIARFDETMAALPALDLVITVDTSVAHLAGAMGRPAWVMLPFAPDWRWLLGRSDTPWYPHLRLFRQEDYRAWDDVIATVAAALRAEVAARQEGRSTVSYGA